MSDRRIDRRVGLGLSHAPGGINPGGIRFRPWVVGIVMCEWIMIRGWDAIVFG